MIFCSSSDVGGKYGNSSDEDQSDNNVSDVFLNPGIRSEVIAQAAQCSDPGESANEIVQHKFSEIYFYDPCEDGRKCADDGKKTPDDQCLSAIFIIKVPGDFEVLLFKDNGIPTLK